MEERTKFDFGNAGPGMMLEIDANMVIDKTGARKLNSSGNSIRLKHNPMLLWKHKNEMSFRPLMEESLKAVREHLSEKILEELGVTLKV